MEFFTLFFGLLALALLAFFTIGFIELALAREDKREEAYGLIGGFKNYLQGKLSKTYEDIPYCSTKVHNGSYSDPQVGSIKQSRLTKEYIDNL